MQDLDEDLRSMESKVVGKGAEEQRTEMHREGIHRPPRAVAPSK